MADKTLEELAKQAVKEMAEAKQATEKLYLEAGVQAVAKKEIAAANLGGVEVKGKKVNVLDMPIEPTVTAVSVSALQKDKMAGVLDKGNSGEARQRKEVLEAMGLDPAGSYDVYVQNTQKEVVKGEVVRNTTQ